MLPSPSTTIQSGNPSSTKASQQPSRSNKKPRKSRSKDLRATTGCKTCRTRHMKCDEQKPTCGPCERSSRPCEYEQTSNKDRGERKPAVRPDPIREEIAASNDRQSVQVAVPELHKVTSVLPVVSKGLPTRTNSTSVPEPPWEQANPLEVFNIRSPQSSMSSTGFGLDVAPLRWFDLLAGDAQANDQEFSVDLLNWRDTAAHMQDPAVMRHTLHPTGVSHVASGFTAPLFQPPSLDVPVIVVKEPWQIAYQLQPHETPIFHRFVSRVALWMDLFDPMKHFSSFVPHLALANEGLMQSILALGARHMSIKPDPLRTNVDRNVAVEYYYKTLHYLQGAMKYESYNRSLELHATALIVSMYEMIDGYGKGWERHLKGVFWIQRSRNIGAESFGLEGAGWWAWLRQDMWAAFREKRRLYTIHRSIKQYADMDQYDLASKSVYLLAQCVNYGSDQDARDGVNNLPTRIERARTLHGSLEEWRRALSIHFHQLPWPAGEVNSDVFQPLWINPSSLAVAVQMYHFAKILLLVHEPSVGGYNEFLRREKHLSDAVDAICGIATTITDEPSTIASTQCLFAAGLFTHDRDPRKREAIVRLIDEGQIRTGWPVNSLTEELQAEWTIADAK